MIQGFYSNVCVSDELKGWGGLESYLTTAFGDSVRANGGTHPVLRNHRELSAVEVEEMGLTPRVGSTWFRLDGVGDRGTF